MRKNYSALSVEADAECPGSKSAALHKANGSGRWVTLLVLCAVVANICSIDRAAMSVAILPMTKQYAWPPSTMGAVSGAFNIGYTITNAVGGWLAARGGPKRVLAIGVVVWSLFTILTPLAAATGHLYLLLAVRALMGVGEGVAFPCMQYLVKASIPPQHKSRALSLIYSGHQVGSIISLLMSPAIIAHMGWPALFYVYGAMGFVWLALWQPLVAADGGSSAADAPHGGSDHDGDGAKAGGLAVKPTAEGGTMGSLAALPWRRFLSNRVVWTLLVAHASFGVLYNMAMAWMPAYFSLVYKMDVRQSSFLSVTPFVAMAVATNASGWVADALINRKALSTTKTRKLMQLVGSVGPAACLWHLALTRPPPAAEEAAAATQRLMSAMLLLTAMLAALGCCAGGFASQHTDISARYAGVLFGLTNAVSSSAGTACVYAVGYALDRNPNGWQSVFGSVAWLSLLSACVHAAFSSSEPQFE